MGQGSAHFSVWRQDADDELLEDDENKGVYPISLAGQPPDALARELLPLEARLRATRPGVPVVWTWAGSFYSSAVRLVIPDGAALPQRVNVWITHATTVPCTHTEAPDWRGHRTRWVDTDLTAAALWWSVGLSRDELELSPDLLWSPWLEHDPFEPGAVLGGVPLATWRALNRAFYLEVAAELDARWSRPIRLLGRT